MCHFNNRLLEYAIKNGIKTSRELSNEIEFKKSYNAFKAEVRTFNEFDDMCFDMQRRLFIYDFMDNGDLRDLDVSDFMNDSGIAYKENFFSNAEIDFLNSVSDEVFNRFKAFGVEKIEKYLEDIK